MSQPREIETYLRIWCNDTQKDWSEWLAIAEFSINIKPASATGVSPYKLSHGRIPNFGVSPRRTGRNESLEEFRSRLIAAQKEAAAAIRHANELMKKQSDKHRRPARNFEIAQKVWLESTNLNYKMPKGATKKFMPRRV